MSSHLTFLYPSKFLRFFVLAIVLFQFLGCQKPVEQLKASPDAKHYQLTGKVIGVDKSKNELTVAHDEIKDYMSPMTMQFKIKEDWVMKDINPGDFISATLVVDKDIYWLEGVAISKSQNNGASNLPDQEMMPEPGKEVPNFQLVNQEGKLITRSQYEGKYLVLTFIYTRCPLPDQCPLMSNNFAVIHEQLLADKHLAEKVHLLSISFDTKYDTPKVLKSYGASQTKRYDKEDFKLWEFASGKEDQIKNITKFFGLMYDPQTDTIIHSLRTAIITPDGKVLKVYRRNQWKPLEIIEEIKTAMGESKK